TSPDAAHHTALHAASQHDQAANRVGNHRMRRAGSRSITTTTAAGTQYCNVTLVYGTNSNQNITIVVGLPLSAADGGTGVVQSKWNGRTKGLGGGGCAGNLKVDAAVDANYVGSGTDGGGVNPTTDPVSALFQCSLWVNSNHTFNLQAIEDFFRIGI